MVFKRKKKPEPAPNPVDVEQTGVIDAATVFNGEQPPDELPDLPDTKQKPQEIPKYLKEALDSLIKYQGVYTPQGFHAPVLQVEALNVAFATFAEVSKQTKIMTEIVLELQGLRKDIKDLNE